MKQRSGGLCTSTKSFSCVRLWSARSRGSALGVERAVDGWRELAQLPARPSVVTTFDHDVRRLRPNLIIGGVEGLAERQWPGAILRLPNAEIALADLRRRCVMTTYDPDTTAQDPAVLRHIVQRFAGELCLNAAIVRGGLVEVGNRADVIAR